jgi:hypothetical protein
LVEDVLCARADAAFPQRASTRRPALGWGISLLVHALVITSLWNASAPPANVDNGPARRIAVWLVPAASEASLKATAPIAAVVPSHSALTRAAPRPGSSPRQPRVEATPAPPTSLPPPATIGTQPESASQSDSAPAGGGGLPAFDLAAARASARAMARTDLHGAPARTPRQENKDAITSDRIQERFERARRVNCLRGNESTNLLVNVLSLAKDVVATAVDDSGCKW